MSARRSTLIVLALLATLSISGSAESRAAKGRLDRVVERLSASVVPVRFTLRPLEAPDGGEGQKIEDVVCGVIVNEDGLIVVSGDPFPDPGGDPRATLIPLDFRVLGGDDVEYPAMVLGMNRDLNLAYLQFEGGLHAPRDSRRARCGHRRRGLWRPSCGGSASEGRDHQYSHHRNGRRFWRDLVLEPLSRRPV